MQAVNPRARLVVLSCCHRGRARILNNEGILLSFLAAGARSVEVSCWQCMMKLPKYS